MNDFEKMDVFFVTATVLAVILIILAIIGAIYFFRILRTLGRIAKNAEAISGTAKHMSARIGSQATSNAGRFITAVFRFLIPRKSKRTRR